MTADEIRELARQCGFELAGVAAALPVGDRGRYQEWVAAGRAGKMGYLTDHRAAVREDPRNLLALARSIICVGKLYQTPWPHTTQVQDAERAWISRYAWGDDYHEVLERRLDQLLDWMRTTTDQPFAARAYVDTGPVQERVYAQYAGLGWIGKNTCLINPEIGSWLFLSEIVCTLDLEPDTEGLEQCGSCTRCLEACPTGALVEAGVLDSNRCISYLTIESRGPLPVEHLEAMGTHVYGCDVCQEVCPYNRPAPTSADPHWQPRPALDLPAIVDLASRDDDDLRAMLRRSAMKRPKSHILRRNLTIALANADIDG